MFFPFPLCLYITLRADRETHLNANYELCGSYPSVLVVPASVTDDEIIAVSQFRSEQRVPVLCWGRQRDSASIWRCSQPKVGSGGVAPRCGRHFDRQSLHVSFGVHREFAGLTIISALQSIANRLNLNFDRSQQVLIWPFLCLPGSGIGAYVLLCVLSPYCARFP